MYGEGTKLYEDGQDIQIRPDDRDAGKQGVGQAFFTSRTTPDLTFLAYSAGGTPYF